MTTLAIDIETYSSADLAKTGVYKYVEAPDFEILLFAYKMDDQPVKMLEFHDYNFDQDDIEFCELFLFPALRSPQITKTAYNANFERTCLAKYFKIELPPEQWECTMAKASYCGLPAGLAAVATALKLTDTKMEEGKALIKYFSMPCKPTKANGGRTRNLPEHDPEKWQLFKDYCVQDVVVEQSIREKLGRFTWPESEKKLWWLDQKINDTGVLLDPVFVSNALKFDYEYSEKLSAEAGQLTDLANPNSVAQLKQWILEQTGDTVESLNKHDLVDLLDDTTDNQVKRMLQIRQEMSKSSVKKYTTMKTAVGKDSRVRGLLQYYGANRTGRWAGRLVQVQNLPKITDSLGKHLELARQMVVKDQLELFDLTFEVPSTLSQLIRTSFIAPPGKKLIVADFSAIEARVIAWLAGEKWRLDVFNTHGKIYEASAAHMFKVPIEQVTKGSDLRNKGKMSELALGYQGGPDAIQRIEISNMTPRDKRIPATDLPQLVKMWRNANQQIVQLWEDLEDAAWSAVQDGIVVNFRHGVAFFVKNNVLFTQLPSGRSLYYLRPKIGVPSRKTGFGNMVLTYEGMEQTRKIWIRQDTYGGKITENIVQAIARDCLADAMLRLDQAGYKIIMHVHDEVVLEVDQDDTTSLKTVEDIMSQPVKWAKGLPLKAVGFETNYYKKD